MTNNLDLVKRAVATSDNTINFDDKGIILKDKNNSNNILFITNGVIAMSTDGGSSYRLSIVPQGIISENLIGKIIAGENLYIVNEAGNFSITKDGFTISNSNHTVMISPDGMLNSDTVFANDNVDSQNPLQIKFYVPDETITVKSVKVQISPQKFRAYSTGAASGGASTVTSASGGSVEKSSASGGGGTSGIVGSEFLVTDWATDGTYGEHMHKVITEHSHNLPFHSHLISIDPHSHQILLPLHTHPISYGIFQSTSPTSMSVKTDGTVRFSGLSGDQNLEISSFITTPSWHTIEITSNQLGRIACSIWIETFTSR